MKVGPEKNGPKETAATGKLGARLPKTDMEGRMLRGPEGKSAQEVTQKTLPPKS